MNENHTARSRLTSLLLRPTTPVEEPTPREESPAEKSFARAYKQPGMPVLKDCKEACNRVADRFGHGEVTTMLQRFGTERLVDMFAGNWRRFFNLAEAAVRTGIPPSESWIEDDGVFTPSCSQQ